MSDADPVDEACEHVERMLRSDAGRDELLTCLVTAAERVSGSVVSILVLDEQGLLRNGASPSLPSDYLQAIDGLKPDPRVGTCAAAAATGEIVVTPSFLADGKWGELRHLPLALGFVGAWSMPIKSTSNGRVLGTFGTYHREERWPTQQELEAVRQLAGAAADVLEPRR